MGALPFPILLFYTTLPETSPVPISQITPFTEHLPLSTSFFLIEHRVIASTSATSYHLKALLIPFGHMY